MDEKCRCAGCGYLALTDGRQMIHEAGKYYRDSGHAPADLSPFPMCSVLAWDLSKEVPATADETPKRVLHVLNEPRTCTSHYRWRPGFAPKEHLQMQFIEEQRKWQEEQNKAIRASTIYAALGGGVIGFAGAILAAGIGVLAMYHFQQKPDPPRQAADPSPAATRR